MSLCKVVKDVERYEAASKSFKLMGDVVQALALAHIIGLKGQNRSMLQYVAQRNCQLPQRFVLIVQVCNIRRKHGRHRKHFAAGH